MKTDIPQAYDSLSPASCRAARGLLKMTQEELAKAAQINVSTVRRYEAGDRLLSSYAARQIGLALKASGIVFIGPKGTRD